MLTGVHAGEVYIGRDEWILMVFFLYNMQKVIYYDNYRPL